MWPDRDLHLHVDTRWISGWWKRRGRLDRLATLVAAGAALVGVVAGDAAAEARVGYDASIRTLMLSVDTRSGPDGNHAYEVRRLTRDVLTREFMVRELAGFANDGLSAATACRSETAVGTTVFCENWTEAMRFVFGDGVDVLRLGDAIRLPGGRGWACQPPSPFFETVAVNLRFGAGNDRLEADGLSCDSRSRGVYDLVWVVQALGEAGNDRLEGDLRNDLLDGGDGNDTLTGEDGGDTLHGGAGADGADGGGGADTLRGGAGGDVLQGGEGSDAILGEADGDRLLGSAGDDLLDGGTGNDALDGGTGDDTLRGGSGNDDLAGGTGADSMDGGDGFFDVASYEAETRRVVVTLADTAANDGVVVNGVSEHDSLRGVEFVRGGHVGDELAGSAALNTLWGGGGDDVLRGLGARDFLYGGAANDQLFGGDGNDDLRGEDGADQLSGGAGDDRLDGGAGNDGLRGEAGIDTFVGGAGRNLMLARDGEADRFFCALGSDGVQADLSDAVPADCETVDRYSLDDGPPGAASGTELTADGTNRVAVTLACPATARVACHGEIRLADPAAPASTLATSAPYTIPVAGNRVVTLQPAASVVTSLAQRGTVAVITVEQGASSAGNRESRRTLTFARG